MKSIGIFLTALACLLALVSLVTTSSCVANGLSLGRDIGAPLNRAQVAAQAETVDKFMAQVQEGMEKHSLTSGHWGFWQLFGINRNVDNDFGIAYEAVINIRARLADIKQFDHKSTEYQVGLDDVRGTIRELNIGQQDWNKYQNHWWVGLLWVSTVMFFVGGGLLWYNSDSW